MFLLKYFNDRNKHKLNTTRAHLIFHKEPNDLYVKDVT